ncbi:MAG TPA: terminase family protein [Rhizomicrobium sp.]|nr:terminase family protein [Rhizomicrobium sp.]
MESLSHEEAEYCLDAWDFWAREEQCAPEGAWRIWLFLGGRGAGKTCSGAQWIAKGVRDGTVRRAGLIAATYNEARAVMIEGESGLLSVDPSARYESSNRRLIWPSGAIAHVLSAEEPDGIRGFQFDRVWGDEFCKWSAPQAALDMALMALRLGDDPRSLLTTTPRNIPALKKLMAQETTVTTRATTHDNAANLAPGFFAAMRARYGGTRLGRQELDGELIADNDGALWQRRWIEDARVTTAPALTRICVAVDPPASAHGDACGIVVVGRDATGQAYVLDDCTSVRLSPQGWANKVADAFDLYQADGVVAEANQGGDMVKAVLTQAAPDLPVRLVHASRGKQVRAAPFAALYEQGRVHHVGAFPALEDEMCNYDGTGPSPDRMDALVWALADLFRARGTTEPRIRKI